MSQAFTITAIGSGGKTTALKELAQQAFLRNQNASVLLTAAAHMYPVLPPESRIFLRDPDEESLCSELLKPGIVCAGRTAPEGKLSALEPRLFSAAVQTASVILCEADGSRCLPLKLHNAQEPVPPPQTDVCLITAGLSALGQEVHSCVHRYELNPVWKAQPDTRIGGEELAFCILDAVSSISLPGRQGSGICLSADRIRILLNQADCLDHSESASDSPAVLQREAAAAVKILQAHGLSCRIGSLLTDSSFLWDWICSPA